MLGDGGGGRREKKYKKTATIYQERKGVRGLTFTYKGVLQEGCITFPEGPVSLKEEQTLRGAENDRGKCVSLWGKLVTYTLTVFETEGSPGVELSASLVHRSPGTKYLLRGETFSYSGLRCKQV